VAALIFLSMIGNVYATPSMIWSQPLPAGLSEETGTMIPDRTYVVANDVIALGSAPCPQHPGSYPCSESSIYPSEQAFWALDANTGKAKWTIPLTNGSVIQPMGVGKFLIAEYSDPNLRAANTGWLISKTLAVDIQTGRIVWTIIRPNSSGNPLFDGNLVVVPDETNPGNWTSPDPTLTAYDPVTGSLVWKIHTTPIDNSWGSDYPYSSVGYGGGKLFVVGGLAGTFQTGIFLTAYDAGSGAKKWSRAWSSSLGGDCPRYMNGILFVKETPANTTFPVIPVNLVALNATNGQTLWNKTIGYSWTGSGTPGSSVLYPCQMVGRDRLFVFSDKAYQMVPDLVALDPATGRELWRHSFPCEYDALDNLACEPVLWNHNAVSDSMLFMSAGLLYGIDAASGTTAWTYGVTADNWNPVAYAGGILFAMNTPNGFYPNLVAFSVAQMVVPEMPLGVAVWILAAVLLSIQILRKLKPRKSWT